MLVHVRSARPSEYDRIGELTVASYAALPVDHLWGGYGNEICDVRGRAGTTDVLVAVDVDDVVRGSVTLVTDPESPWREWAQPGEVQFRLLAVDRSVRSRGIGAALVRACLERAGERPVIIHTTQWMDAAQRLYARLGFERRPERDVPQEDWYRPDRDHDLPDAWNGAKFLAYSGPRTSVPPPENRFRRS